MADPGEGARGYARVVPCPGCGQRNRIPPVASGRPRCPRCKGALPWLVDAGDDDFAAVVEQAPIPVLVDCWAPWCGPCRTVSPLVENMAARYAGRLKVAKVNVDTAPTTAARFNVRGIPTLLLLDRGTGCDRLVGAPATAALEAWITRAIG